MQSSLSSISVAAHRYARSLFDLAHEESLVARVEEDFTSLKKLLAENLFLKEALESPILCRLQQSRAIQSVSEKYGMVPLFQNFLAVLVENRRFSYCDSILCAYQRLSSHFRGEVFVRVISAKVLANSLQNEIEASLKKILKKNVVAVYEVNSNLLDGLVIEVASYRIDASLSTRLKLLEFALKEA